MSVLSNVSNSEERIDRFAAARDLWPGGTLGMWQGEEQPHPDRVFWPESEEQVLEVLREASKLGVPVVPYGAGSGVCGGARGRAGSWVLDTKRLCGIGPLDEQRWTVEVDAGTNGQQLEDWLNDRGFTLGHSPSSIWCSTVGGWAAARSAGQFSSKYGVFEDMVLRVDAVSPGHGVFSVGEGCTNEPMSLEMLLGSEGTLAVVTKLKLRVWPQPKVRRLRGYRFSTVQSALAAMRRLMAAEVWPAVVRLYDPVDTRIGGKTKPKKEATGNPSFVRRWLKVVDKLPGVERRTLALPLTLPGVVNRILNGASDGCLVIVGFEGEPDVVDVGWEVAGQILAAEGEDLGEEPGNRWFASRHAVSYKLMPVFERGGFADTMEIAARWSLLEGVYEAVRKAVSPTAVVMAHMSHVYPEGGCIYFSFAGRGDRSIYEATWKAAQDAVLAAGATVTHHHGVGMLKAPWASAEVGPAIRGWREVKTEHDPSGVLNPGRLFVECDPVGPPVDAPPSLRDGLVRVPVGSTLAERHQAARGARAHLLWPWEEVAGPSREARRPYQTSVIEVSGVVDSRRCLLGRGPRSAAGSDLRGWLLEQGADHTTLGVVPQGATWCGLFATKDPWSDAVRVLRADLRPGLLDVVEGCLRVGFRGPAAASYGRLVVGLLGECEEVDWPENPSLPSGKLVPTEGADAVWATAQGLWRHA